ncbi:VOC family protein [Indioceanicola profundi]|uniref:VOC family protein n=1 Tax=Indioceanicola profundi TaxID=2220096 RepID=UPI001CEDAF26|nr:VOC family protein [Indioceanicola profundi]
MLVAHVSLGVSDLPRSAAFYDKVLATLGVGRLFEDHDHIAYGRRGETFFIINLPLDPARGEARFNNGGHICFRAASTEQVQAFHRVALENGATDNGGPGLRPHYTPTYYAAFVLDPDGHNIEAVTYVPESPEQG